MSSRVVPSPMLARTAPGRAGLRPARSSAREAVELAVGTPEQLRHQQVRAEAAMADADRVLGAQDRRQQRMPVAVER